MFLWPLDHLETVSTQEQAGSWLAVEAMRADQIATWINMRTPWNVPNKWTGSLSAGLCKGVQQSFVLDSLENRTKHHHHHHQWKLLIGKIKFLV